MDPFYIGLITTAATIVLFEAFGFLEKRLLAAFTLTGIAFIYIGFAWKDIPSMVYCICAVGLFVALSYYGYKNNSLLIVIGLILHGVWDWSFHFISSTAPDGYGVFCLTVDILLAIYFFFRLKTAKPSIRV